MALPSAGRRTRADATAGRHRRTSPVEEEEVGRFVREIVDLCGEAATATVNVEHLYLRGTSRRKSP